jgi:phosphoglycerate dehydrogenase-like enzyme
MVVKVTMFAGAHARVRDRLEALDLPIEVVTFDDAGSYAVEGFESEAIWLSPDVSFGARRGAAFGTVLDSASAKWMQTFNAGLDDPTYKKISDKGIRITNSSAQAVAIAEYVMAHVLSLVHPLDDQRAAQAANEWKRTPFRELSRTTWLTIGYKNIGPEITKRAKAFDATVYGIRRTPQPAPDTDEMGTMADLPRFLPEADVVVLACALNDETRRFANAEFFRQCKEGAILVNVARGALIDDAALIAALDGGRLDAAVLDVFDPEPLPADDPFWTHPKIRVTAHTSFAGEGTAARGDELFLDNIARYSRGEPLLNEVDPSDII